MPRSAKERDAVSSAAAKAGVVYPKGTTGIRLAKFPDRLKGLTIYKKRAIHLRLPHGRNSYSSTAVHK